MHEKSCNRSHNFGYENELENNIKTYHKLSFFEKNEKKLYALGAVTCFTISIITVIAIAFMPFKLVSYSMALGIFVCILAIIFYHLDSDNPCFFICGTSGIFLLVLTCILMFIKSYPIIHSIIPSIILNFSIFGTLLFYAAYCITKNDA